MRQGRCFSRSFISLSSPSSFIKKLLLSSSSVIRRVSPPLLVEVEHQNTLSHGMTTASLLARGFVESDLHLRERLHLQRGTLQALSCSSGFHLCCVADPPRGGGKAGPVSSDNRKHQTVRFYSSLVLTFLLASETDGFLEIGFSVVQREDAEEQNRLFKSIDLCPAVLSSLLFCEFRLYRCRPVQ